jgi:hypothetical protein
MVGRNRLYLKAMNQSANLSHPSSRWFGLIATFVLVTNPSRALVIDDFNSGPLTLQVTNLSGQTVLQNGLPTTSVIGGSRLVYGGTTGRDLAVESIDTTAGRFNFINYSDFGYFRLTYGSLASPLGMDLTLGGNHSFELSIADLTPGLGRGNFDFKVDTGTGFIRARFGADLFGLNGPGNVIIPFSSFAGADMTHVRVIEIEVGRFEPTFHIAIDSITTVPEPSIVACLSAGLATLFYSRRRFR